MKHVNNASLSVSLYWSVLSVVSLPVLADSVLPEVSVSAALDSQEERRMSSAGKLIFDRKELEATDSSTVGELLGNGHVYGFVWWRAATPRSRQKP